MRIELVTTEAAFAALRSDWNALALLAERPSVFLLHDWFMSAWAWRRHSSKLRMLVARDGGDTVAAIFPLVSDIARGRRTLTLLTVPDTQSCDIIANPACAAPAAAVLANALSSRDDWDQLRLDYLHPDGLVARGMLPALRSAGLSCALEESGRNLFIPLQGSWESYWATRTRSLKKASSLATNRLNKAGAVRIERLDPATMTDAERERMLCAAVDVSRRSWKQTTGNSLDHAGPGDFIRTLSRAAQHEGWLSIWLAFLDDCPVAMEYQLVHAGNVHALRSDFDAECVHLSPGSYLFRHLIEALFAKGLSRYFMGPGDNAYKTRWTDEGEPLCRVIGYNRTVTGRLAYWLDAHVKPALRPLRNRFRVQHSGRAVNPEPQKDPR